MNRVKALVLKGLRKLYQKSLSMQGLPPYETNPDVASDMIYQLLISNRPCMIARFGSTELSCMVNYLGVCKGKSVWKYIKGDQPQWWWNRNIMNQMQRWSGFFPPTEEKLSEFCELMLEDAKQVDVLGSWLIDEKYLTSAINAQKVMLLCLEPYWSKNPWSRVLEGKHVLVVHPFAEDIISQYNYHREQLFEDKKVLPKFASLRVVKAVQSLGGESNGFKDWFEALEWMKNEMDKKPYDIALIGCGAYGFPLAAHAKCTGHKSVHLGGALQLLFGIKGHRWENPNYGVKEWGIPYGSYSNLMNEYWVRPSAEVRPKKYQQVENACYW